MFTKEELELLKNMIINYPLQGNIQTLPEIMKTLVGIIDKINVELNNAREQ